MTSVFDQFEQASQRSKQPSQSSMATDMVSMGIIQMNLQDEIPIFIKQKVNFLPSDRILHMCVSNNFVVIAMANNVLLRIDMKQPDKREEIDISKFIGNLRLSALYLCPLGQHLLISAVPKQGDNSSSAELFYLHRKTTKLKQSSKCRGHEITAVAWNYLNTSETSTGPILLGTSKGTIFETELGSEYDKLFTSNLEQYWKQVFDIGKESKPPITGIEFRRIPNSEKYLIILTTLTRIYQYSGVITNHDERPLLQQVFIKYLNITEHFHSSDNSLSYSKMQFYFLSPQEFPKAFGWLTESDILYAQIDSKADSDFVANFEILPCPETSLLTGNIPSASNKKRSSVPLAFVLTEFHILLLYIDHVKGVSLLNQELIFEDIYNDAYGKLVNIIKDPAVGSIWAYSERAVFRYKVTKEDRNVWQVYIDKGEFELAKQYCGDNPVNIDKVLIKQAESLYINKEYAKSALIYAQTHSSFEEICLKFMQENEMEALQIFLAKKLESLSYPEKTQITMIVSWVIELFMSQMGELRYKECSTFNKNPRYIELQEQFDRFLSIDKVKECICRNHAVMCNIIASHGDKDNLVKLSIMNKNYKEVIKQHIYKNNYLEALEVLKNQPNKDLFYQFSSTLMQEIPRPTVSALIGQGSNLKPTKLLPALAVCYKDEKHAREVIRYLEHCIYEQSCQEQAIHNFLLSLYVVYKKDEVLRYINSQGQDISSVHYDVGFALRLCQQHNLTEASVQLAALLGLWTTAVDLALKVNVDLAKQVAAMPLNDDDDDELKKKLWLKIAEHVVQEKNDIKQAMEFLKQCDLIRIEDILPFFSDFVTIGHFKEAICNSLQEYNRHMQDLKEEMEESTKAAEVIRKDIQEFRTRCTFIRTTDPCNICGIQLLLRGFYAFPCGHNFHGDCLVTAIIPMLTLENQSRLAKLQNQLSLNSGSDSKSETASISNTLPTKEQIKADIDELIASDCIYCGELMINSIDKPFIEEQDYEKVMKEWS